MTPAWPAVGYSSQNDGRGSGEGGAGSEGDGWADRGVGDIEQDRSREGGDPDCPVVPAEGGTPRLSEVEKSERAIAAVPSLDPPGAGHGRPLGATLVKMIDEYVLHGGQAHMLRFAALGEIGGGSLRSDGLLVACGIRAQRFHSAKEGGHNRQNPRSRSVTRESEAVGWLIRAVGHLGRLGMARSAPRVRRCR